MQDKVPTYPTTGNKTARGTHWAVCILCYVFIYSLSRVPAACYQQTETYEGPSTPALSLCSLMLSTVPCDCNWLESLKLASPCQCRRVLKSRGLIQPSGLQKPHGLLGGLRTSEPQALILRLGPNHHPPPSRAPCLRRRWLCLGPFLFHHWSRFQDA